MKNIFNKVFLLVVALAVTVMSIRVLTVLIPQKAAAIDPSEGIAYLAERETAVYTEPSPTPVPTEPTAESVTYYEIKDNNFKAAFKDIYFAGDSITEAMYEYGILDLYHVTAAIGVGTSHIDRNLSYIVDLNPKYLVLHYGVNVMGSESDALPFIENYKASIEKLQEKLPDTVIFVDSIFPVQPVAYKQAPGTKNVDYYNQKISEMCAELGVHYLNHTPLWENYEKNYYEGDGIHPIYSYYTEQYLPYIYTEVMKTSEAQELSGT
ncbi:MAG: hypothetical protein IKG03_08295 [Clostridiales bacterium]|nr:hypothetical protein [Clostridiales bacterium]